MWVQQHLTQRYNWDRLGQRGTSKQWPDEVFGDGLTDRAGDQIHLANELDSLLCFLIEHENEAEDIARIDKRDDDDVPRVGNLVIEDHVGDARLDELKRGVVSRAGEHLGLPCHARQRPVVAFVLIQNL